MKRNNHHLMNEDYMLQSLLQKKHPEVSLCKVGCNPEQAAQASADGSVKVVLAVTNPGGQAPGSTDGVTRVVGRINPQAILQVP